MKRDNHEVLLKDYFDEVMFRINPGITYEIVEESYKQINNLALVKFEELNAIFHKYLIEEEWDKKESARAYMRTQV